MLDTPPAHCLPCYTTTYITVTEEAEESEEEGEESGEEREDGEELRRADERRRGPNGRSESSGPIGQLSCARWFFERLPPNLPDRLENVVRWRCPPKGWLLKEDTGVVGHHPNHSLQTPCHSLSLRSTSNARH